MRTALLLTSLAAVAAAALIASPAPAAAPSPPPANARFDYQIGGAYRPASGAGIVDRDRSDKPAAGAYGVCYVNAFQTQSSEVRWWKRRHRDLLLRKGGRYVVDSVWNEILLDTSTPSKRAALATIVGRWIDGCARAGYQAVEPDNLDSFSRSKHRLTKSDNLAFARRLVGRAHAAGLAIAQKNTVEISAAGKALGFDFAIAEECQVYDECGGYTDVYDDQVYEVEYPDNGGRANFRKACEARGDRISITYRDREVVRRGRPGYLFDAC